MRGSVVGPTKNIWRACEDLAAELPYPDPFDLAGFIDALAVRRGRRIDLVPIASLASTPCGMLLSTEHADYIFHATRTTELHQLHIVAHEVGHLLFGHEGASPVIDSVAIAAMMPNLSADLVRRVLGRSAYTDVQETQAELLASLILHRAGHVPAPRRPVSMDVAETLARLGTMFDSPSVQRG